MERESTGMILLEAVDCLIGKEKEDSALVEVNSIKVNFSDGSTLFLDGQLHTVWSTQYIPHPFNTTEHDISGCIDRCFHNGDPLVLFMAPGYDVPSKDFLNFLMGFDAKGKFITRLTLLGNKSEELEIIPLGFEKKQPFILGLWPWQYIEWRKVKSIGNFEGFHFEALKKDFYIAEIEIDLLAPSDSQPTALRGCALKTSLTEKTRLIILSNLSCETVNLQELTTMYLNHWPNLEEAFGDFSRKIELLTYAVNSQHYFSTGGLKLDEAVDIKNLFNSHPVVLDAYLRWYFLPSGSDIQDFSVAKARFYDLKAILKKRKDYTLVILQVPPGYQFAAELSYICCRLNEREIIHSDGSKLWFLFSKVSSSLA